MKKILAGLLLIAPLVANADNWLCIGDNSTGFVLKNGAWESAKFKPYKYLIKSAEGVVSSMGALYQVHEFGREIPSYICPTGFLEDGEFEEILDCYGLGIKTDAFKFNPKTGHFLMTRTLGYVMSDGKTVDDTPSIEIGKCSKL